MTPASVVPSNVLDEPADEQGPSEHAHSDPQPAAVGDVQDQADRDEQAEDGVDAAASDVGKHGRDGSARSSRESRGDNARCGDSPQDDGEGCRPAVTVEDCQEPASAHSAKDGEETLQHLVGPGHRWTVEGEGRDA